CSPFIWTHIPDVQGEEPAVPFEVLNPILSLAVHGLLQLLDNLRSCRLCSVEMRIDVIDENRHHLSACADLQRTRPGWPRRSQHDPSIAEMHLGSLNGVRRPVTIVLDETEHTTQPCARFGDILIHDVRQDYVARH